MNFLIYFVIIVLSIYFWYHIKYGLRNKILEKFPAPKSFPILNHGVLLAGKTSAEIFEILNKIGEKYGPIFRFDITPFTSIIGVNDPKVVEGILLSNKCLSKGREYDLLIDFTGDGLLITNGKKWHQRRKIIAPAFSLKILEQFVEIMLKHADVFVEKIKKYQGQQVDIFSMGSLYALDVICESTMGYQLNAQNDIDSEYVKAVKEITNILLLRIFDVKKRVKFLYRLSKMYKREQDVTKKTHEFTNSVIAARRKYLNINKVSSDKEKDLEDEIGLKKKFAFLDLLLQTKVDGEPLDEVTIREEVDTFMFAGHDTTSSAIAFTFLNLAKYPDIQEKVYEECQEVLKDSSTMQDLNQLSYLDKVIKETLRLYPSVANISRRFDTEQVICGHIFPADVSIRISPFMIGRDPNLFKDPLKFDPSRFDNEEGGIKGFLHIPFSAGPRNCIGQKFAMLELKSIISKTVEKYEISITKENEDPILASEVVLRPIHGIKIIFNERKI